MERMAAPATATRRTRYCSRSRRRAGKRAVGGRLGRVRSQIEAPGGGRLGRRSLRVAGRCALPVGDYRLRAFGTGALVRAACDAGCSSAARFDGVSPRGVKTCDGSTSLCESSTSPSVVASRSGSMRASMAHAVPLAGPGRCRARRARRRANAASGAAVQARARTPQGA
ncbi:hypothetical protein C7S16_0818 [Burkholderia thailandensis]|uniref:Uncharacterized protein n=1 Tax=Burkholderia thailandensis TaxID=57975 RepID=A0AAW9D1J5_BURTH|nr:hypothetical protein [Burkholderia thailandensis]MDW9255183.1 hypothetical protein [Burkholderia thailandensis]